MKILLAICIYFGLAIFGCGEERVIPFDELYVSVETNDWRKRPRDREGLHVKVSVSRGEEEQERVSIDVNCFEFPVGKRMLLEEELLAFDEAAEAGLRKEEFSKETMTKTFHGPEKTVFETRKEEENWVISVSRVGEEALFDVTEGQRLRKALAEAQAGKRWFEQLLIAQDLPEATPDTRPPQSTGYYVVSKLGEVKGRGIDYDISVSVLSLNREPQYSIMHQLRFRTDNGGGGSCSGAWVEGLLRKVSEALEAIKKRRNYSFKSGNKEHRYSVTANLETKEADVIFHPGEFFGDQKAKHGHFGEEQLAEIRALINSYEARKNWFQEHEEWFFTRA